MWTRRELAGLGLLAMLGAVDLRHPFRGDQALFMLGAEQLHRGAVLYRDFWDIKQPGIYLHYLFAGSFAGFSESGIHLFGLGYMLAFAALLQIALRPYFSRPWSSAFVPLAAIGPYYAIGAPWVLEQAEAFIGAPLFASLWLCLDASRRTGALRLVLLFLSGMAGAGVVWFKLLYAPVVAIVWGVLLVLLWNDWGAGGPGERWRSAAAIVLGMVIPLGVLWAVFAPVIGAHLIYQTFIIDPMRIASELPPRRLSTMLAAVRWFAEFYGGVVVLAAIGATADLRLRRRPATIAFMAWIAAGGVMFLTQRDSWWSYQLILLTVPIGVLAVLGIETVITWLSGWPWVRDPPRRQAALLAMLFAAFGAVSLRGAENFWRLARAGFAIRPGELQVYQFALAPEYREAWYETAFLRDSSSRQGDIFVMGDPTYYLLAHRQQAIALNGWMLELYLPEQWRLLRSELKTRRPPYLFVTGENLRLVHERSSATEAFIGVFYRRIHHDARGDWFETRAPPA